MVNFVSKSGRELQTWEVSLGQYLAAQPPTEFAQRRHRAIHALAIAIALEFGHEVPARAYLGHTEAEIEQARLEHRAVRGDLLAKETLRVQAEAEGRHTTEEAHAYRDARALFGEEEGGPL